MEGGGTLRSDVGGDIDAAAPAEVTVADTRGGLAGRQRLWASFLGNDLCWRDRGHRAGIPAKPLPSPELGTERLPALPWYPAGADKGGREAGPPDTRSVTLRSRSCARAFVSALKGGYRP